MDKKLNVKADLTLRESLLGEGFEKLIFCIKKAAIPISAFFVTFTVAGVSPALGVYPFGGTILSSVASFPMALAVLLGCITRGFTLGEISLPYIMINICIFAVRYALGKLCIVKSSYSRSVEKRKTFSVPIRDSPASLEKEEFGDVFDTEITPRIFCAVGGALAIGLYNILTGTNLWYDVFSLAFGCILAPVMTFAFSSFFDRNIRPTVRRAGVALLCYGIILALSPITFGGMNVAVVVAFSATLFMAYATGAENAALFGVFAGLGLEPAFCAMYAIGGVVAATLFPISLGAALFCSAALSISWALYADGIGAISGVLPEIMLASLIIYPAAQFKIIPDRIDFFVTSASGKEAKNKSESLINFERNRNVKDRVENICKSLSYMSTVLGNLSKRLRTPEGSEVYSICEEAFSVACTQCAKKNICHSREGFGSGEVIRSFAKQLKESGNLSTLFVPDSMLRGCPSIDSIISNINRDYNKLFEENMKYDKTSVTADNYENLASLIRECVTEDSREYEKNKEMTKRLEKAFEKENITYEALSVYGRERPQIFVRGVTVKDLSYGACDLREMAEEALGIGLLEPEMSIDYDRLNMYFECRKKLLATYSTYSLPATDREVSGDIITSFYSADEKFYMLLCDGMGSGRDAALTARISSIFLERMLRGGATVESAMVLLNNFTRERRIECFSTIDLLCVDLYSGKARFVKSGGAASFVMRGGNLFKLECETMPVGILKELSAKAVEFELMPGDTVIMMSDGVTGETEAASWLYDIVSSSSSDTAKKIVKEARRRAERTDDTTVGIVNISEI